MIYINFVKRYSQDYDDYRNLDVNISIDMLDSIIAYLFTFSKYITNKNLTNIKELFNLISSNNFRDDLQTLIRYHLIKLAVKCRLDFGIKDYYLIIENIRESNNKYLDDIEEYIFPAILENNIELTKDEIKFINNFIYERLRYIYLYQSKDYIIEMLESLDSNSFDSIKDQHDELINAMQNVVSQAKKAKMDEDDDKQFSLTEEDYDTIITDLIYEIQQPTNYLKTGIKYLNNMLNGGFEAGRCTLILGTAKSYKSGLLLSIAHWIKRYNKDYKVKDKTKTPAVLYLTQENSLRETLERLYNLKFKSTNINDISIDRAINKLKGRLHVTEDDPIDVIHMYRRNKSITTEDLYYIIDELENSGYEIIALVHDYIKRIRPSVKGTEVRYDLANVVDDFCTLAKTKNIAVITAHQLNREAARIIENAIAKGTQDIAKQLGSSNVGDSWAVIENADISMIIYKEYKKSLDKYYLTFKLCNTRVKLPEIQYFAHPFDENGFTLLDDYLKEKSLSIEALTEETIDDINNVSNKRRK